MTSRFLFVAIGIVVLGTTMKVPAAETEQKLPNIVVIYTDDIGYADVGCYGAAGVNTPHIDRLATEGLRFTDAHCSAATCTPSRFALLTGSYAFRQKGTGVLSGDAAMIIRPGTATMPSLLKSVGYTTAVVGKWHLGLGNGKNNWNGRLEPGPEAIGFDYHFLIPATGDRVPCVYVEDNYVVGADPSDPIYTSYGKPIGDDPTGKDHPELLKQRWSHGHNATIINGISRIGFMQGGNRARWVDEEMADTITEKAVQFIKQHRQQPFFLYFCTHDIHVPRVPHQRFQGISSMGFRGDAIAQLDWCVGKLLETLDELEVADNTLVLFTSDNGPVLDDGYHDLANERIGRHHPAGPFRGGKYSPFEGGTRVPLIVRWPGHVPTGDESSALVGQIDFARSLAQLVGADVPDDAVRDSRNQLDALLGRDPVGRPHLIHEAGTLALRQAHWKYIPPCKPRDGLGPWQPTEIAAPGALFDLRNDPGEQLNLAMQHPQQLRDMADLLARLRADADQ